MAALRKLADERLLAVDHHGIVELHRGLPAADAQQRQVVRHEQRALRQHRHE